MIRAGNTSALIYNNERQYMILPAGQVLYEGASRLYAAQTVTATQNSSVFSTEGNTLICHLTVASIGGTTPTLDVKIQDTADGVNWVDVPSASFTQITANTTARLVVSNVGLMARAVLTVGGTTPTMAVTLTIVGRSV